MYVPPLTRMVEQEGSVGISFPTGGILEGAVLVAFLEEASPSIDCFSCPQHVAFGSWVLGGPDMD